MKILFLGTGAADWKHDKKGDAQYRRNASLLIDDVLLIDPGPCVPDAIESFGVDIGKIRYVLNTHTHDDHLNPKTVRMLKKNGATLLSPEAGEEIKIGGYKIKALRANHSIQALHFLITSDKKTLFYGLDGAWLLYDEFRAIKEKGVDFAIFDATLGNCEGDYRIFEHNSLSMVIEMKKSLEPYVKRFCISHMSKTFHEEHQKLKKQMDGYGIETAYDGLETEI